MPAGGLQDEMFTGRPASVAQLVEVRNLTKHFPLTRGVIFRRSVGAVHAVNGIDFSIARGETLSLVGESGCGKSTTGRTILRLYRPTAGSVTFDGIDVATLGGSQMQRLRSRMQMIFQDPYGSLNPRMTVGSIIGEPLEVHGLAAGRRARRERVRALLHTVGLSPSAGDRYPHEFSGGQRQRIGIARALAPEPEFVVADEPVSALDVSIKAQITNLMQRLQEEFHLTYLFISHDLAVVRQISDRIAVMYLGSIVELAHHRDIYERPLHPYSVALLSAVPIPDPKLEARRRRIILNGDAPSPVNPPSGCTFHPRCPLRERLGKPEVCSAEVPRLVEHSPGRWAACHFAGQL